MSLYSSVVPFTALKIPVFLEAICLESPFPSQRECYCWFSTVVWQSWALSFIYLTDVHRHLLWADTITHSRDKSASAPQNLWRQEHQSIPTGSAGLINHLLCQMRSQHQRRPCVPFMAHKRQTMAEFSRAMLHAVSGALIYTGRKDENGIFCLILW
jgi:hypothetical protein